MHLLQHVTREGISHPSRLLTFLLPAYPHPRPRIPSPSVASLARPERRRAPTRPPTERSMLKEERGSTKSNCSSGWRYLPTANVRERGAPLLLLLLEKVRGFMSERASITYPHPSKISPVRPKHSTRTTAGVACCAAAPEPVAGFISGNCVTIGVKSPPSEFQRFPRFNPSPNERPSRSALAPSSWLMACGLFSSFSRQTLALPYLTRGSLKLQKGPSLLKLLVKLNFSLGTY